MSPRLVLRGRPRGREVPPECVCGAEVGGVGFVGPSRMWVGAPYVEIWGDPCFTEENPEGRRGAPQMSMWGWGEGSGEWGLLSPYSLEGTRVGAPHEHGGWKGFSLRGAVHGASRMGWLLLPHSHGAGQGGEGWSCSSRQELVGGGTPHG